MNGWLETKHHTMLTQVDIHSVDNPVLFEVIFFGSSFCHRYNLVTCYGNWWLNIWIYLGQNPALTRVLTGARVWAREVSVILALTDWLTDICTYRTTVWQLFMFSRPECNSGAGDPPLYVNVHMRDGSTANTWIDALQVTTKILRKTFYNTFFHKISNTRSLSFSFSLVILFCHPNSVHRKRIIS